MQSIDLGFSGKHLIAMQGPFSREMNLALLHQTEAKYFVTKESGKNGGFAEKLEAAEQAGAVLLVIGRPIEEGLSVEEAEQKRCLCIVHSYAFIVETEKERQQQVLD